MAEKVRFFKGTKAKFDTLENKVSNYVYFIYDEPAIYLGSTKVTSSADITSALTRISALEDALDGIDLTTEGSVRETIDDVLEYIEGITGDLEDLDTTADSSLVAAINENKSRIDSSAITLSVADTPTTGYLKTYVLSQGSTQIGVIDIPKDLVIQSGSVVEATAQNPVNGQTSGTFLELVIANQTQHLFISVDALIDVYTAQQNATQVQLSITNGVISASVVAGSITSTELASNSVVTAKITDKNVTKAKLEQNVQNTLSSADTHIASTSNPHSVTYTQVGAAAASHNHAAGDITSGTLSSARGGTGQSSLQDSANALIKALSTNATDPVDGDYIIAQYPGGGSTTETYHRKSVTALYNYMKSKMTTDFAAVSHGNHVPVYSSSNNGKVLKVVDGTPIWSTDNNTTYTIEEGTTNGTIKVTPSGGSASNIAVHGLGSAAYTSSSDYATSGHVHTLTLASDSGTSSLALEANTKYKLTAGGSTLIFTTPAHQSLSNYSTTSHTHSTSIATSTDTNQITLAFGSKYKLTAGGTSYVFTMPSNPDTNTTYGFTGGTNKFTVTPSSGSAYDVTVTPSITNNVTGSGTSGYLAKFNGANTITNGPAFGSATDTFLRNDGTWVAPPNTNTKVNVVERGTTKAYLLATTTAPTSSASAQTAVAESGVYLDTTAGKLVATTFVGSLTGTASGNLTSSSNLAWSKVTGTPTTLSGYGITDAAGSGHTHTLTLASDTGTSTVSLTHGGKFKLTAGGNSVVFTMPSDNNTTYTFAEGTTNGTFSVTPSGGSSQSVAIHGLGSAAYTESTAYATSGHTHDYASSSHTHTLTLASDTGTSTVTLASAGKYKLTAGGNSVVFTMPTIPTVSYPVTSVNTKTGAVTLSASDVGAASSSHTHDIALATDSGTSTVTLASATKYKLTAGGKSVIFTMPTIPTVSYPVTSVNTKTGAVTLSASDVGAATSGHNHDGTYLKSVPQATDSTFGGFKTGYSTSGNNRAVLLDANGVAYVTQKDTTYTFDGTYNSSTNKAATVSTVTSAIGALDGVITGTAGTGKTLSAFSQTDGTVTATFSNISITKSQVSDFPSSMPASDVSSWAKASSKPSYNFSEIGSKPTTISGYGITDAYTKTEVDGKVSGVLHYKGTKSAVSNLPTSGNTTGDVWHITADGSERAWDGTEWQELGTAVDLSGYVPTSRKVAGKALTGDITLSASDVGAATSGHTHTTSIASGGTSSLDLAASTTYTLTAGGTTYAFKTPPNTTYESKSASSGGTAVSLVTTGEKYTWNNKSNLTIGDTSTTAAAGNHTHTCSIATDSGTNQVTLAFGTKYKLTAGGSSYVFTMPGNPNSNTTYTFANGTNGFTVTPSGGSAQTVTVTPSIANNVTGSGTSGYLAKFNGANTITNGPALGSATTTYLRNDGSWATPTNTLNTAGSTDTSSEIYLIGATSQGANPQTYSHDTARVRSNGRIVGSGYEFATASAMGTTKATMVYDSTLEAVAFQFS